jgi:translation initiation factor 1
MPRDRETRLAYSTGGEQEDEPNAKPSGKGNEARRGAGFTPVRGQAERRGGIGGVRRNTPRLDGPEGIRLRLERRASSRVVTLVTGLPGNPADVAAFASELKAACGAGGTLKDGALELQGDHRDKVEMALRARGLRSKRAGG